MNITYDILLYHGVHEDELDLGLRNRSGKHIPRRRFEAEMKHLSQNRQLVSMSQIAAAHRGEFNLPKDAVAVTFDDGFLNNYTMAWPVLEAYRVPVTIYLATGFIGTGRMIWSDRLESLILGSSSLNLTVDVQGMSLDFPLNGDEQRVHAFMETKALCKSLSDDAKNCLIDAIEAALHNPSEKAHPLYQFMDWDQVREMNCSELVSFGAHTVDHVALARVSPSEMIRQIDGSIAELECQLGQRVCLFSYPEGQDKDYNDAIIAYLESRGIDHAPSAIDGSNTLYAPGPFHMRRIMVGFEGRPYPFAATI